MCVWGSEPTYALFKSATSGDRWSYHTHIFPKSLLNLCTYIFSRYSSSFFDPFSHSPSTSSGKRYDTSEQTSNEAQELHEIVREGFELLGAFNWSDHLPWLNYFYDPSHINQRCLALVPRVKRLLHRIIEEHKLSGSVVKVSDNSAFVDVLLSLEGEEKLHEDDMVAVLWVRLHLSRLSFLRIFFVVITQ